jgi:hypothetical protein
MCELDRWLDDGGPPEEEEIMEPNQEEKQWHVLYPATARAVWVNEVRAATGEGWLKNAQAAERVVDEARANAADEEALHATDSWLIRNTLASAADEQEVRRAEAARWAEARKQAEAQCRISGVDQWRTQREKAELEAALKSAADVALKAAAEAVAEMAKAFGEMARSMRAAWLELHPGEEKEGES